MTSKPAKTPNKSTVALLEKTKSVLRLLYKEYPNVRCSLLYSEPWQLLIATILSAQCTDARVNIVCEALWQTYHSPQDFVDAPLSQIEQDVHSTGFFRNKAKNIQASCQEIINTHGGVLPKTLEELNALPGVGRKTANVVLGEAFGQAAVVVDTHVKRVCGLLGLTKEHDPVKIEFELMDILPRKSWSDFAHLIIHHGRAICVARRPNCPQCCLKKHCNYAKKQESSAKSSKKSAK